MDCPFRTLAKALAPLAMLLVVACSAPPTPPVAPAASPGATQSSASATPAPAAAAGGVAIGEDEDAAVSPAKRLMQQLDRNGDGRLSRAEHASRAEDSFRTMDSNHDGEVSVDEMDAVRKGLYGENRSAASAAIAVGDSNRDGMLSAEEHATATRVVFERIDTDHDASLSLPELEEASAPGR